MEKEGKTVYLAGAVVKFTCHSGFELDGPSEISCSMGNWSSYPTCSGNIKQYFSWNWLSGEFEILLNWS